MAYQQLIDIESLKTKLGIGGSATVYRRIRDDPHFPKPVKIGRLTRFVDAEVDSYIERLVRTRKSAALADNEAADLPTENLASGMGSRILPSGPKRSAAA